MKEKFYLAKCLPPQRLWQTQLAIGREEGRHGANGSTSIGANFNEGKGDRDGWNYGLNYDLNGGGASASIGYTDPDSDLGLTSTIDRNGLSTSAEYLGTSIATMTQDGVQMDEINWMQQNINAAQDASETLQGNVETLKERGYSEEQIRNMTQDQHDELVNKIRTENDNNTLVANGLDPDTMTPDQRSQALYDLQPIIHSPLDDLLGALGTIGGGLLGSLGIALSRRREDEEGGEAERDTKVDGEGDDVSQFIRETLDIIGEESDKKVLSDSEGDPINFAQASSDNALQTDGNSDEFIFSRKEDQGIEAADIRYDLEKPIKDSYNEFISGEKEFSRKDFVDYIQSIASETYKEQGVVDFAKDVANSLIFGYLKKEASLMYRDSKSLENTLTLLGSVRDINSLTEHVSALVGPEMDTIKGVMRQEMIVQTEKLLEANKKYYETEKKAIKAEQTKLDQEMKIYKASNEPKQLALIEPAQIRMTELTLRDLKLTSSFKDSGKQLDQIRLLKNKNFEIIENSIDHNNDLKEESKLSEKLRIAFESIYGSDSTAYKSFVSQDQKMNQYVEAHKMVRVYEIIGDVASLYPKSPAVDIMISAGKIGLLNNNRRDLKNDFSKYSTSSSNRAREFYKALREKILNRKIE